MNSFEKALHILGLKTLKNKSQLKKAYRIKSKKYHPDNGGSSQDFIEITKSYKFLEKKLPDRYQVNLKVEDIVNKKLFKISDRVKIHATAHNLLKKKIEINIDKPMIINFNYMDKKKYPLTFEDDKCFINVDVYVEEDEFAKGYTHIIFANKEYTLFIPNRDELKNDVSICGTGISVRFHFIIKRPCQQDGNTYKITSEEMSKWYLKHNIMG